ncbi:MAG: glycosyltransferase family 4 protein [Chloroflexota bacterium]|nr:glycosyltransferase family 4 protein [Chloroflexota bacterium]MDE2840277.1 glycosyltransferase family 4 protein [Chloroflexota bacterium]MDE2930586.1 glycosyltransferase family 4 protein [Chloroflexota bacterium]
MSITPNNAQFVILSFEGPDRYSQAGGLGTRVTELARALAQAGFTTHLIFIGDPSLPSVETTECGNLHLYRWCQWISHAHPTGAYEAEWDKLIDYANSVPWFVTDRIVRPAADQGQITVVMAEEWHTTETLARLSDSLHFNGLRQECVLLWNANNEFGFGHIDLPRLDFIATITTVSRFMKHRLWDWGLNPLVLPNGIPRRLLEKVPQQPVRRLRRGMAADFLLLKMGRFDPDKRWLQAIEAAGQLKHAGHRVRFIARGGLEPHGGDVLHRAAEMGLVVQDIYSDNSNLEGALDAILAASDHADVLNLCDFVPEALQRVFYSAVDAVLANSGYEPFGLVGLEAMACGAVVVTGTTGEDYAVQLHNALSVETDDPAELASYLQLVHSQPDVIKQIKRHARQTAALFTWDSTIRDLVGKVEYLAAKQGIDVQSNPNG